MQIAFLKKLTMKKDSDEDMVYAEARAALVKEWPGHLPLLREALDRAVAKTGDERAAALPAIVAAADEVSCYKVFIVLWFEQIVNWLENR